MIARYATRLKFARACAERPDAWEEALVPHDLFMSIEQTIESRAYQVWRGERKKEAEEQTVPDEAQHMVSVVLLQMLS